MSLLYAVVFASRCRSTHHRLAIDALRHLRSPDAEAWRNMLLHFHGVYLKGAKAPDDEFKDFKNHVLHVRDRDWGGAIEACEEWQRRTVRALMMKDWEQAAWSAGVLSHYYVDPHQPFHTHQTEEENIIHRAVEWSFNKSYRDFQEILETTGGYPEVRPPAGEGWLSQLLRAGASVATKQYETIIDHYDFDAGVKNPIAGLDGELRHAIAPLIGIAAVGFARVLDRTFEEAAVRPPRIGGTLQALFLGLQAPIQQILKQIDDAETRKEVAAQYEEFRRTGKVRSTLGEDDRVVRELYAAEVLKTPLSSLDAKWPREIGEKTAAALSRPQLPKPKPAAIEAPKIKALPPPKKTKQKFALDGEAPVQQAPSIGPKTARRLEAMGVMTVNDLLQLSPEDGEREIATRHISAQVIKDWQAQALLACSVPGLKSREAQALVACGVRTSEELTKQDANALTEAVAQWGLSEEGARAWGSAAAPTEEDVAEWIERARSAGREPPPVKQKATA